ncbi:AraC family transcriptional regulator [Sphingobium sp. DEHP117]|uniref:helix-turn-helix domain-containing protein n=1 Tax=Sphingobium sp. DEHP117 TaxID=2993436 RepID=UPI0027D4BBDA|nr:helix-turn-helix domain-containing protein [Sphingobium sp. DEHP117]MDQ4421370.1 AraC family transcriptional regulator [Sphingobium sp. DEHP117]
MDHAFSGKDEGAQVELNYWEPSEKLRYFFGSIYRFTTNTSRYKDMTRADMPQLRFMVSGHGNYEFCNGEVQPTPEVCMVGPTMGATRFLLQSPAIVYGVSVLPLGWLAMCGPDASEAVDTLFDVGKRMGERFHTELERLRAEADADEAVAGLWTFLESELKPVDDQMIRLVSAIDEWLSESDSPQIEDIVAATGLSARQLARYTNKLYGAPPKLLARKYRALRCASQIVIDKKNWTELCDEGNFYDQSHFIREIKQFLGHTPHQLLHDPTAVARLTVQRRALTGLSKINRIS